MKVTDTNQRVTSPLHCWAALPQVAQGASDDGPELFFSGCRRRGSHVSPAHPAIPSSNGAGAFSSAPSAAQRSATSAPPSAPAKAPAPPRFPAPFVMLLVRALPARAKEPALFRVFAACACDSGVAISTCQPEVCLWKGRDGGGGVECTSTRQTSVLLARHC
jgi:hypothetical protein